MMPEQVNHHCKRHPVLEGRRGAGTAPNPCAEGVHNSPVLCANTMGLVPWTDPANCRVTVPMAPGIQRELPLLPLAKGPGLSCQRCSTELSLSCQREWGIQGMPHASLWFLLHNQENEEVEQCAHLKPRSPHAWTARKTTATKHPSKNAGLTAWHVIHRNRRLCWTLLHSVL